MSIFNTLNALIAIVLIASCANDGQTTNERTVSGRGGAGDGQVKDKIVEPQQSNDCVGQWTAMTAQTAVGTKYVYQSVIKSQIIPAPISFERVDEIKSVDQESVRHFISVNSPILATIIPGFRIQELQLSKAQFLKICEKFGTKSGLASTLGTDVQVTAMGEESLNIEGRTVTASKIKVEAKELKYGPASVTGYAVLYVSAQNQSLLLKQTIFVVDSSIPMLKGAEITDELKSGMPLLK